MATTVNTNLNPDMHASSFGLSGWLDGIANLSLLYGAGKIRSEFPEQYSSPQNPVYQPDTAVNELQLAALRNNSGNNVMQYGLIGLVAVAALGVLIMVARK